MLKLKGGKYFDRNIKQAYMNNYFKKMLLIYDHLQDEESRSLFEARITYLIDRNIDEFLETVHKLYDQKGWHCSELEKKIATVNPKGIIICGCGHDGRMTNDLLSSWGYKVTCFCDSYNYGKIIDRKSVLSFNQVIEKYKEYLIVIGSTKYGKEMYVELVEKGFPYMNILLPEYGIIWASRGTQYFDLVEPKSDEIYIDAGAYDGETILDFKKWTNGNYKKIYAFEPLKDIYDFTRQRMLQENVADLELLNYAVRDRKEDLRFMADSYSSQVNPDGNHIVKGIDIDSVVKTNEKVTLIKMDVEGSELKALKGSKNTILNSRPRLAICIYHKPMDIIEIPAYILELNPEYKFYIRHYGSHMGEEVLYGVL